MSNCATPFVDDFQWAVIRLATLQIKRGEVGRLLFATVTLLSPDRPPPPKMVSFDSYKLGKSGETVFFRRTVLSAQAAVDWYRSLRDGNSKAPVPSRQGDIWEKDGVDITVSDLVDDPLWPNLGLPMGEGSLAQPSGRSNPTPFMGGTSARVHRRFGNAEGFELLLANDEALAFIARRLHINLRDYPEYLGSAALVVPDPIIKQIDNFLIPASDGRGERIFYRFVPRPGQTLDGLKITTFDEQALLLSNFETKALPADGILDETKGSCIGTYGYVVTHPVHGVLLYHPPTAFLRTIHITSNVVSSGIKVNVPLGDSPQSPRTEYRVHRSAISTSSVIGDEPLIPSANARVAIAAREREKAASALHYDQRLFRPGSRREAMEFIRSKIGRARESVMIADPYFWGLQIGQYLWAVSNETVKTTILTSRLAFEGGYEAEINESKPVDESSGSSEKTKLEDFTARLEELKQVGKITLHARVLLGKSPVLHDRFLVVDKSVWLLGSSLNALGDKRSSMVIQLPNPDEMLNELAAMFENAIPFGDYLKQRMDAFSKEKQK